MRSKLSSKSLTIEARHALRALGKIVSGEGEVSTDPDRGAEYMQAERYVAARHTQVLRALERSAARAPWTSMPAKAAIHAANATASVTFGTHPRSSSSTTARMLNVATLYMPRGKTNAQ